MTMIDWLLDGSMGPPGLNGHWFWGLSLAFHLANLVSFLGFTAATAVLVRYVLGGAGLSPRRMALQTGFLPAAALKCAARVAEVGGPRYHLTTILDIHTAVWVVAAAVTLPSTIRYIRARRLNAHDQANRLQAELIEKELLRLDLIEHNGRLSARVDALEHALARELWTADSKAALADIRALLHRQPGSSDGE